MKIKYAALESFFTGIGFKRFSMWKPEMIQQKLKVVPEGVPEEKVSALTAADKKTYKAICKAVEAAEDIEFDFPAAAATKKTGGRKKAAASQETEAPASKSKRKGPPPAATRGEPDKFGNGDKTNVHKINQVFFETKKALTVEEVIKASKCNDGAVRAHLRTLGVKGFVSKSQDGKYKATGKTK